MMSRWCCCLACSMTNRTKRPLSAIKRMDFLIFNEYEKREGNRVTAKLKNPLTANDNNYIITTGQRYYPSHVQIDDTLN